MARPKFRGKVIPLDAVQLKHLYYLIRSRSNGCAGTTYTCLVVGTAFGLEAREAWQVFLERLGINTSGYGFSKSAAPRWMRAAFKVEYPDDNAVRLWFIEQLIREVERFYLNHEPAFDPDEFYRTAA